MVRLCMTQSMVSAIHYCSRNTVEDWPCEHFEGEPSLQDPKQGQPISHGQVIALSQCLKRHFELRSGQSSNVKSEPLTHDLDGLLRGSRVYIEPPKPKPEPVSLMLENSLVILTRAQTSEYKTLMARLREEEEARAYERMMNPTPQPATFNQHFPASSGANLFPASSLKEIDEEVTYSDINRQVALIINVLVSIIACSVAIWMAARHWSTPLRLGLSMGGSGVVGIAEVVVYAGYIRRVKEAKELEKKKPEIKEIIETWVIDPNEKTSPINTGNYKSEVTPLRKRVPKEKSEVS